MNRLLFTFIAMSAMGAARADVPMQIELVSSVRTVQPGQPFYVALALEHGRGYHSYWKMPGIVGVPTSIKWTDLPRGFSASEIDWPAPERVYMFQIKSQGYERDVLLPVLITPPKHLKPGSTVTLKGKAGWMSCAKQCNPGFKDLSITLPVSEAAETAFDEKWKVRIDTELARRPVKSGAWTLSVEPVGDTGYVATLSPGVGARPITEREARKLIWFTEDGQVDTDKPQRIEWSEGRVVFHLERPDYLPGGFKKSLTGVLVREGGWHADGSVRVMRVTAKW